MRAMARFFRELHSVAVSEDSAIGSVGSQRLGEVSIRPVAALKLLCR